MSLRTVKRAVTAAVVLAVLAVALPVAYDWWDDRRSRCAEGVVRMEPDGECVGVTDGSHTFADHLDEVTDRIREANEKVVGEDGDAYVSVAYMTSFTVGEADSNSEESVRHELQGAYLAQQRHNEFSAPKIRLLIANTGSESRHWKHTVGELVRRKDNGERLVAVTGLGPSTGPNREALNELSKHELAMVASTMTATDFHGIEGFVRVAPTNVDEARVASAYLRQEGFHTAMVVQDVAKKNPYARTLGRAFTEEFPKGGGGHRLVARKKTFDSSVSGNWRVELRYLSDQLCIHKPQAVYFAGRGQHLTHFLNALANRACPEWGFTVMTGDDTSNLTSEQVRKAVDSGVQVFYTGLAHPEMWRGDPKGPPRRLQNAFRKGGLLDQWFAGESHADGQAMMAHDAVLTAAEGARMVNHGRSQVTGEAVSRMFHQMQDNMRLRGASGPLSFESDGDAYDKAVPILRLDPNGTPVFVTVLSPGE